MTDNQIAPLQPHDLDTLARVCGTLAKSTMIPRDFQRSPENCLVAMLIARKMGEDPITLMQHMYILHGRASFSTAYMIARANASGRLRGVIMWDVVGTGDDMTVTAYATLRETGDRIDVAVSMRTAIAEKWTKNSKYRSMPELMLRYRSASQLIRLYLPDVLLGHSTDELQPPPPRDTKPERVQLDPAPVADWESALSPAAIEQTTDGDA